MVKLDITVRNDLLHIGICGLLFLIKNICHLIQLTLNGFGLPPDPTQSVEKADEGTGVEVESVPTGGIEGAVSKELNAHDNNDDLRQNADNKNPKRY